MALKHGDCSGGKMTDEYRAWCTMKRRCYEKNFIGFSNWGGRGIRVCDKWLHKGTGYINFLHDIGRKPSKEYSLDRIDNDGDYKPGNVKWSTRAEQARNKRDKREIIYNGITKRLSEWAEEYGLLVPTLTKRIDKANMSIEDALVKPLGGELYNSHKNNSCPHGHPFSGDNLVIEDGYRRCRACRNKNQMKRYYIRKNKKKVCQ